ncbi:MAG: 16S rRNA (uracil(1498)-N(3))-methyltransferase [Lachnospiraceae bacterium]|nr:16S rRNA (uracil(1498)-N(3))-methyltransferase [Lachnospiraceae bacterium]
MDHFFTDPSNIRDKHIIIEGSDVNHIRNVLRLRPGDEISVSNGVDGREYRCGIVSIGDVVECELRFIKEESVELPVRVHLFQGLCKGDKMETVIQKTTELGVYEVIPVQMIRSVVKLDDKKAASKVSRYVGVAEAAAKQSKRAVIPQIHPVCDVNSAIEYAKSFDKIIVPYELSAGESFEDTRKVMGSVKGLKDIAVFIGPEGGFDDSEIEALKVAGADVISLGRRILRTETAGMTVLSWLVYLLED